MIRLTPARDRDALPEAARAAHDEILKGRAKILGPIAIVLPRAPELALATARVGDALKNCKALSKAQIELAVCVTSRAKNCGHAWAAHARAALKAGVTQPLLDVVNARGPLHGIADDQALIIRFGRELIGNGHLTDATYGEALAIFGEEGVMELAVLMGYYSLIDTITKAMLLEAGPDAPRLI